MDQEEKIKYIYDEIQNNNVDNDYIIKYIHLKNIKYTENNNGIFINLSKIDDIHIDILYKYINEKSYNVFEEERDEIILNYMQIANTNKTIDKSKIKYKQIKNLSDIDLEIIELSKTI